MLCISGGGAYDWLLLVPWAAAMAEKDSCGFAHIQENIFFIVLPVKISNLSIIVSRSATEVREKSSLEPTNQCLSQTQVFVWAAPIADMYAF